MTGKERCEIDHLGSVHKDVLEVQGEEKNIITITCIVTVTIVVITKEM